MKWLDMPPVWLLLALVSALGAPFRLAIPGGPTLGVGLLFIAAVLFAAALLEFRKAKTTVIPGQKPSALITSGIFAVTRNPIYVADVLVLFGLSMIWGSVVGLALTPVFASLLQKRFILGEEARLRAAFPHAYDSYAAATRRWL